MLDIRRIFKPYRHLAAELVISEISNSRHSGTEWLCLFQDRSCRVTDSRGQLIPHFQVQGPQTANDPHFVGFTCHAHHSQHKQMVRLVPSQKWLQVASSGVAGDGFNGTEPGDVSKLTIWDCHLGFAETVFEKSLLINSPFRLFLFFWRFEWSNCA